VSKTSVAGSWGAVSGSLRYFADPYGNARAAIEGTTIPLGLVRKYATTGAPTLVFDGRHKSTPLALERRVEYFGFELEHERVPVQEFPPGLEGEARRVLADALARGVARHAAVARNREAVESVREAYRRSGGATPRLSQADLTAWYEKQLSSVRTLHDFRAASLRLGADEFVAAEARARLMALPGAAEIRDRTVPMHYEVEELPSGPLGVVRLVLPEKIARNLVAEELPEMGRPLRFTVHRGARGSVKADSLADLQDALDRPFSDGDAAGGTAPWTRRGADRGESTFGRQRGAQDGRRRSGGPPRGHDKGTHRPGSPSGRGKRRGKGP
jgi:ATP-dependent RNA helicase HrpA